MFKTAASFVATLAMVASLAAAPALAQAGRRAPPDPHQYWEGRRDPPPGHEFRQPPQPQPRWDDRRLPPPNWNRDSWRIRQEWLQRHGHRGDDFDSVAGFIVGAILGYALGAAVVDTPEHQTYAHSRLNDPGWIAYCARKYASFDPYTGTYLGYDGLRHYCR